MKKIFIITAIVAVLVLAYFMLFYRGGGLPDGNATFIHISHMTN